MPVQSTRGANSAKGFGFTGRSVLPFISATGGTVSTSGDYKSHIFTGDGTFQVTNEGTPVGSNSVEYFVIGGGAGGGGFYRGGGGGAGGFRTNYPSPAFAGLPIIAAGAYPVTVGAGGPNNGGGGGAIGTDSVFSTITSARGGSCNGPGGSGGGTNGGPGSQGLGNSPPVSPPQGNNGGWSPGGCSPGGGGGGGAGGNGNNGSPGFQAPAGPGGTGAGISTTMFGPVSGSYGTPGPDGGQRYFSGGGGGGTYAPGSVGSGSSIGGGGSGNSNAGTNTGGGGGTGSYQGPPVPSLLPSQGGSGIVVIRYKFQ